MYPSVRNTREVVSAQADPSGKSRVLSRNLIALGITSFFTDISSEMVLAVVPLFLTTSLGFSIFGFGLFEAAYQGTSAVFRIWGGGYADRDRRHKRVAATGYGLSTLTRFGLIVSTIVAAVPAVPFLLADRVGKGLRASPRDALISLSTAPDRIATAFAVHRSLDTAGAMLGPLVAFAVLTAAPGAFDAVFVVSAIAGVIGVATITTFAEEKTEPAPTSEAKRSILEHWQQVRQTAGMSQLVRVAGLLSMFTVGDAFLYLIIQRSTDLSARFFPLLFVVTAGAYLLAAVPFGRIADRIGTRRVFLAGHAMLGVLYIAFAFIGVGAFIAVVGLVMLGIYYAATDGVVAAMSSQLVPTEIRASGIAVVTVAIALGRMVSAALFGFLWHQFGAGDALTIYLLGLVFSLVAAAKLLPNPRTAS